MKKPVTFLFVSLLSCFAAMAQTTVFRTGTDTVKLILDGKKSRGGWHVAPELNPDILKTTAGKVVFASDRDTLVIDNLKEWESFCFDIVTDSGDTSHVKVDRIPVNVFENPDPQFIKKAASGRLSKAQAVFDIDALVYGLSQVHPDIFSVCRQEDFFRAVNRAKAALPDSVTPMQLYQAAAPVVAMIGDGHTNLYFPFNSVFTKELKRFPVFADVMTDRSLVCTSSLDSIIPRGSKILSINKISADSLINSMLPYVSGEREHFRIARINTMFQALLLMLYPADEYEVVYKPAGAKKALSHIFPAVTWGEIDKRCDFPRSGKKYERYSFEIDSINNVAVMDFREFSDVRGMEHFADSMFTELRNRGIGNLIIDIRNNGGGQSAVGDVLLRYFSPEPFVQMDKTVVRVTPLTARLAGEAGAEPRFVLHEKAPSEFIQPRSIEDGFYTGRVYLLTSNKTFSSAGSFAWAFKECGMGKVIGEETGGMNVCYGDILGYRLPVSKLNATISFKRFWQLRADENDIHGTMPDVAVPAADALDAAMKLVRKNKR